MSLPYIYIILHFHYHITCVSDIHYYITFCFKFLSIDHLMSIHTGFKLLQNGCLAFEKPYWKIIPKPNAFEAVTKRALMIINNISFEGFAHLHKKCSQYFYWWEILSHEHKYYRNPYPQEKLIPAISVFVSRKWKKGM